MSLLWESLCQFPLNSQAWLNDQPHLRLIKHLNGAQCPGCWEPLRRKSNCGQQSSQLRASQIAQTSGHILERDCVFRYFCRSSGDLGHLRQAWLEFIKNVKLRDSLQNCETSKYFFQRLDEISSDTRIY